MSIHLGLQGRVITPGEDSLSIAINANAPECALILLKLNTSDEEKRETHAAGTTLVNTANVTLLLIFRNRLADQSPP